MAEIIPFQYPSNAMINFQPLDSALSDYQRGMRVAGESTAKINAANMMAQGKFPEAAAELAKVDPAAAMKLQMQPGALEAQKNTNEEATRKLIGGTAEAIASIPDPALRAQTAQKLFSTDPRWASGATKMGFDLTNPAHIDPFLAAAREEALGPQAPESRALTQAKTAQALTEKVGPAESLVRIPTAGAAPAGTAATPASSAQTLFKGGTTLQTQEDRQAAAEKLGLQPGSEPYKQLMVNGKLPDHDLPPREATMVDQNAKAIQAMDILTQKLNAAKSYSKEAFQGAFSQARTNLIQSLPWLMPDSAKNAANATEQLRILETGRSLGQAKTDAGARVTAFLEQLELRLRADPNMPDKTRQELLDEAKTFIAQNREFARQQNAAILNRTAFKPGGENVNPATGPQGGPPPAGRIPTAQINEEIARARDAIARGKSKAAVRQLLIDNGITPPDDL